MKQVVGFLTVELMNGDRLEFLNDEALTLKSEVYDKWINNDNVTIDHITYTSTEIYDINYSFVTSTILD